MKKKLLLALFISINSLFSDLTLAEKKTINLLIHTMATRSNAYLIYHRKDLRVLGDKLMHLSPLEFFTHILTSAHRKNQLKIILGSYFTRTELIDEAVVIFNKYDKQKLSNELGEFSQIIHKNLAVIQNFVHKRDWKNLILYIAK